MDLPVGKKVIFSRQVLKQKPINIVIVRNNYYNWVKNDKFRYKARQVV